MFSVVCWRKTCKFYGKRKNFNTLVERKDEKKHYDYVCPECESVIICSSKRIKV